jgi:hypothetical protein
MIDLDKLEELDRAATPGPWGSVGLRNLEAGITNDRGEPTTWEDALLIAATRNALPALIAELRASRDFHYSVWRALDRKAVGLVDHSAALYQVWEANRSYEAIVYAFGETK